MLSFNNVARNYRSGTGVAGLTFTIQPGEIVALVGLNGAGKTTLIRLALGMLRPDSGTVTISGQPVLDAPAHMWSEVGALVDHPLAYPELTVRQNLNVSRMLRSTEPATVAKSLADWRLEPVADRRFRRLSQGNQQRVGLAAAMHHNPRLIILDEPSNSLDPASVILLRNQLRQRAQDGAAIMVSSHHLDEVSRIADRVLLMNGGRLIGQLDTTGPDLERAFFDRIRQDDEQRHPQVVQP